MTETQLHSLKDYNPDLCERLARYSIPTTVGFQLCNAESGDVNLIYNNIPLHSNKSPQAEAMEEFNRIKPNSSTILVLMGLGLGYVLKRFYISSKCKIVIYEPDINILKFTLMAADFSEELASGRVFLANTSLELEMAINKAYSYKDKVVLSCLPSSKQLFPHEVERGVDELTKVVPNLESNFVTLFEFSRLWLTNGLSKFHPMFLQDKPKKDSSITILENKFRGKAALIVSAGPSLDRTIEVIRTNREKFVIFCVNVAYKKLSEAGITPDFTVCLDAHRFIRTISQYEHAKTNVIIHSAASPFVFTELQPHKFFTLYCKNDLFSRWLAEFCGFSIENYKTKGFVSHLALVSAYNMGCNPIIMTGQDLAFTDGKTYSSGSFWGDICNVNEKNELVAEPIKDAANTQKLKQMKEIAAVKVKGQNGDIVLTSPAYAGFIKHLENFAAENASARLINCSPGGAMIEGFENMELQNVADAIESTDINVNEYLQSLVDTEKDPVKDNFDSIISEILPLWRKENYLPIAEKGQVASNGLLRELKNSRPDPGKIKKLYNEVLKYYDLLEERLFSRWEFGIAFAFKEITELNAVIKSEFAGNDISLLVNFARCANNLFATTRNNFGGGGRN